ncbi:MAG: hypothetical protein NTW28_08760, partial [Candidatus Solibacter sp.]|nr:hypothetical protein [Candidatus Solibacter sp.]
MMPADPEYVLSRRQIFLLAGAGTAACLSLHAGTDDFWNKKAPADCAGGGYPGGRYPGTGTGGGYPGGTGRSGGGIGIPGIGGISLPGGLGRGRGNGGGSPRGGAASPYEGIVRWESARPILDAMKCPLPEAFESRYVISVSGIPLMGGRSMGAGEDDDSIASRRREQDDLDRLKGLSSLQPKGRDAVQ